MWSSALAPKAADWGPNVDVVGGFFLEQATSYDPPPELVQFLEEDERAPIFVGFGSMVIEDTDSLTRMIVDAAAAADVRVLVQSNWSALSSGALPKTIFPMGPCPHDWLLPRMAAVVHHGGA
eukprot:CAMPEP_0118972438 /NCGR_PEP_ID=MMETSP1173-20130426/8741_1 /TAXON_ID=1034831 /ORGANISM="Rhizochromulina marina cf, Strain CCMP1243" /LENGTH=121 /DNA_ID=CAMNT_0006921979 /DNA_START=56 /DNA_END=417 /DNA_ORIENTATION=+